MASLALFALFASLAAKSDRGGGSQLEATQFEERKKSLG
jgi:hypothetical protein